MFTQHLILAAVTLLSTASAYSQNFTIINDQVYTPGHVIIKSPQPWTPVGGDSLQLSLDVTANGKIPLPPYEDDAPDVITDIAIYLTSRITGHNFTITDPITLIRSYEFNQTYLENFQVYNSSIVMWQEPGSSVKHVNWRYPDCFASLEAAEEPSDTGGWDWTYKGGRPLGAYNVSIHQYGRIGGETYFSVFNLPIIIKDDVPDEGAARYSCFQMKSGYYPLKPPHIWTDQQEGMGWWDYPWAEGKDSERVVFESKDMGEYIDVEKEWPEEEGEARKFLREGRERWPAETFVRDEQGAEGTGSDEAVAGASEAAGPGEETASSEGTGAQESAPLLLVVATVGLALVF